MHSLRKAVLIAASIGVMAGVLALATGGDRWQSLVDAGNAASRRRDIAAARKFYDQAVREAERSGFDDPRVGEKLQAARRSVFLARGVRSGQNLLFPRGGVTVGRRER